MSMNRKMVVVRSVLHGVLLVLSLSASSVTAATIRRVPFDEMVRSSGLIVEATVIRMTTEEVRTTSHLAPGKPVSPEASTPPVPEEKRGQRDEAKPSDESNPTKESPVPVDAEAGSMIFTRITLALDRTVKGSHGRLLHLRMPGGTYGDTRVFIPGLPAFEMGKSYFLFLRPDCEETGVPFVGVSQGFFRIEQDPATGEKLLKTFGSDDVIGVQAGRVISRRGSERPGLLCLKAEPPHPEPGYEVVVPPELKGARRFLAPTEKTLTPDDLTAIIRMIPEWDTVPEAQERQRVQ